MIRFRFELGFSSDWHAQATLRFRIMGKIELQDYGVIEIEVQFYGEAWWGDVDGDGESDIELRVYREVWEMSMVMVSGQV
ncbi:Integrin Alpha-2 [Manis pentadactyla]|nr:Integrin Alpha-2 [Manis pentadactyla]